MMFFRLFCCSEPSEEEKEALLVESLRDDLIFYCSEKTRTAHIDNMLNILEYSQSYLRIIKSINNTKQDLLSHIDLNLMIEEMTGEEYIRFKPLIDHLIKKYDVKYVKPKIEKMTLKPFEKR